MTELKKRQLISEASATMPRIGDTIWVIGRIDYEDYDSSSHKTTFCFKQTSHLSPNKLANGTPIVSGLQIACDIPGSNFAD
jgi:hypothetical protein